MPLTFESTHEYYLKDASIYYCEDHDSLIVTRDYEDRVVLGGVKKSTLLKFAQELINKNSRSVEALEKGFDSVTDAALAK